MTDTLIADTKDWALGNIRAQYFDNNDIIDPASLYLRASFWFFENQHNIVEVLGSNYSVHMNEFGGWYDCLTISYQSNIE